MWPFRLVTQEKWHILQVGHLSNAAARNLLTVGSFDVFVGSRLPPRCVMTDCSYQVREHVEYRAIELGICLDVEAVTNAILAEAPDCLHEALAIADDMVNACRGGNGGDSLEDDPISYDSGWCD
jgi:hypothetical protein